MNQGWFRKSLLLTFLFQMSSSNLQPENSIAGYATGEESRRCQTTEKHEKLTFVEKIHCFLKTVTIIFPSIKQAAKRFYDTLISRYNNCSEAKIVSFRLVGFSRYSLPLSTRRGVGGEAFCPVFSFLYFQSTLSCTRIKPKLRLKRALIEAQLRLN